MPITPLPTAPSRARPATFSSEADALLSALPTMVDEFNASMAGESAAALSANLASTATGKGASLSGVEDAKLWFSAVVTKTTETVLGWIGSWLWGRDYNVFQYLSVSEIASVKAYNFAVDVTASVQAAMDASYAAKRNLFAPAGGYLVTGLVTPGLVNGAGTDDRDKGWTMYGQGFGEPFVTLNTGGTVFKSVTNAPVLQDQVGTASTSNGTQHFHDMRFDGTSSTSPVVKFQSMYGQSSFHHCVIYQRGAGDGFWTGWGATIEVHNVYAINSTFASSGLGAARTGVGFTWAPTADNGLVSFRKCTARGWHDGYIIGGGAGNGYNASILFCECSKVFNGVTLTNSRKAVLDGVYMEGGDGGIAVIDNGYYTTIRDCLIFPGFAKGIDATNTTMVGTDIHGNIISLGNVASSIGIDIASSAAFGGYNKNAVNNIIVYTAGTAGVIGIKVSGTDPRITLVGNAFDPRSPWTGAGSVKISDTSSNGVQGLIQKETGNREIIALSRVSVYWQQSATVLTEANVSGGVLTLPDECSYYVMTPTVATTINSIAGSTNTARELIIRTTNANATFVDTAQNVLAGSTNYAQTGILRGVLERVGGNNFFYETSRTAL